MYAKDLEYLLIESSRQSDVSPTDFADMATRFESLRGYGKLPRGRESRAKPLTTGEIAAAIAGLVPSNPKWAGHGSLILTDLRPVGGVGASFQGAATLSDAMSVLLTDEIARMSFLFLSLSLAESGTNSNGFARLAWQEGTDRREAAFVSKMAVSQLQAGAEARFDFDYFHARASRALILNEPFFERVARAVERATAFPAPPAGDGSEYDVEEVRQARFKALGVRPGSRFLNIGVETQVTWPKKEMLVAFDKYRLVLMPKTTENTQSIHVDLHANRLSDEEALTVINRFLSLLAWCDDQFAVAQGGWSGNPVPVAVSRRDLAFATAMDWPFDRKIPAREEARKVLGLFREGRNAEEAGLSSYAVLSYFKIIETRYDDGQKAKKWIGRSYPLVVAPRRDDAQLADFLAACGSEAPEDYIYKACRHAVAHASSKHPTDADDFLEIRRLYSASHVLHLLARHFIAAELGVSDSIYSGD